MRYLIKLHALLSGVRQLGVQAAHLGLALRDLLVRRGDLSLVLLYEVVSRRHRDTKCS